MSSPETEPPRFGVLHPLWLAPVASPALLLDVVRRWKGVGLLYIHLLLAVVWLPLSVKAAVGMHRFVEERAPAAFADFPVIHISQGRVRTEGPEPRTWADPESGQPFLVVDTTGTVTSLEGRDERLLLTAHELLVSQGQIPPRRYDLRGVSAFYLDREGVLETLQRVDRWFFVLWFGLRYVSAVTWKIAAMLVYALIAMGLSRARGAPLIFAAGMRLAAVALTPALLLDLVFGLVGWSPPLWGLAGMLVTLLVLGRGVAVHADETA